MEEYLVNEFLYYAFPTIWPVLSFFVFGKNVYCFVKNRYYELGLYDPDVDEKTTGVSFLATIVFVFLSIFDITGLAGLISCHLCNLPALIPIITCLLKFIIATIVDYIFYKVTWHIYLKRYIEDSI